MLLLRNHTLHSPISSHIEVSVVIMYFNDTQTHRLPAITPTQTTGMYILAGGGWGDYNPINHVKFGSHTNIRHSISFSIFLCVKLFAMDNQVG